MVRALLLPPLADVEELRVLEWHAAPGDGVPAGFLVVELETYKALVEVRTGSPGVVRAIRRAAGEWQAPGGVLAILSDAVDEPLPDDDAVLDAFPVDFDLS